MLDQATRAKLEQYVSDGAARRSRRADWANEPNHPDHQRALHAIELVKGVYAKGRSLGITVAEMNELLGLGGTGKRVYRIYHDSKIKKEEIEPTITRAKDLEIELDKLLTPAA